MIQYSLKCAHGHQFDSWFQSAAAFDKLKSTGLVTCAICGTSDVEKVLMAPAVRPARSATQETQPSEPEKTPATDARPLSTPASPVEEAVSQMRRHVEATSEYVGENFAARAREMHDGDAPEKPIYGEANLEDARKLVDDGVPILALPFRPGNKDN